MPIDLNILQNTFFEHHQRLLNVALNLSGDRADADDIIQDVFLKLWQKKEVLHVDQMNAAYLNRAVINTALNHLEKKKGKINILSTANVAQFSKSDLPDEVLYGKELKREIERAIESLPPKCKTIFVLSRYEGLKYREIALELGLTQKTVENQMGIALKKLHGYLRPYVSKEFIMLSATAGIPAILAYILSSAMLILIQNH